MKIGNREVFRWAPGKYAPDAVMLYALEPMLRAARLLNWHEEGIQKSVAVYAGELHPFPHTLSHYAEYIREAMLDLHIPLGTVSWDNCIPGYYQGKVILGKSGVRTSGEFHYRGLKGGRRSYFPNEELSWSAKFFLDALWWTIATTPMVSTEPLRSGDSRLLALEGRPDLARGKILDAGCGTGRYIEAMKTPCNEIVGMDVKGTPWVRGGVCNIPFHNNEFDAVYCVEVLEHALNKPAAISELCRVTRPGGKVFIIDKSERTQVKMKLAPWERWPETKGTDNEIAKHCCDTNHREIDHIFTLWEGIVI